MNTKDGMKENNFEVIRPGVNTTYQDFGRKNLYHIGVPFSGAMDNRNYLISNKLVNNKINSAVIEFAYQGPMLKFNGESTTFAITGDVNFNIKRKKNSILEKGNSYQTYNLKSGDEIDILSTNRSVYGYLAIAGNIDVNLFGNSCSTNTKAKIGSNNGEKIKKGDKIFFSNSDGKTQLKKLNYINTKIEQIRVIRGTNYDYFSKESKNIFFKNEFNVTKLTDRMGMRLEGNKIKNIVDTNIKSEGLIKGTIQIPADGNPIIMLSDHGTIGGYPKIGVVISADYDKLVQIVPGSKIKFKEVSLSDAEKLYKFYNLETQNILNQIS
jgi:biotin-dependent carboxylase-like uncharacterized protein|tara:strand:+ start:1714 stop:2685 length:972 start_codon:yes stop_codon:yes gene_type:complete